jgi:UDP-2,4-diacetamido-2,4,6-trideoxy-beta-L-altropyranose hydrolase
MGGTLLIRADAGATIGVGHAMRMLALAEAWIERGGAVVLLGDLPEAVADKARNLGARVEELHVAPGTHSDAEVTRACAQRLGAGWIAADGYHFAESWQRSVRDGPTKLLVVDDNAENAPYVADCVLNLNVHAEESLYAARGLHTRLLLGPRFALIRSEFRRFPAARVDASERATRWLVTMGGADPTNATGRFLEAVVETQATGFELEVLVGDSNPRLTEYQALASRAHVKVLLSNRVADVSVPMRRSDLALSASGGTVWELALLGVPAAVVTAADNQVHPALALAKLGVVVALGDARDQQHGRRWLEQLIDLSNDARARRLLISRARALVDGQGALRVVRALKEEKLDAEL